MLGFLRGFVGGGRARLVISTGGVGGGTFESGFSESGSAGPVTPPPPPPPPPVPEHPDSPAVPYLLTTAGVLVLRRSDRPSTPSVTTAAVAVLRKRAA